MEEGTKIYRGWDGVIDECEFIKDITRPGGYEIWLIKNTEGRTVIETRPERYSTTKLGALKRELSEMETSLKDQEEILRCAQEDIDYIKDSIENLKERIESESTAN